MASASELHDKYEPHPDPSSTTTHTARSERHNVSSDSSVSYTPHPSSSAPIAPAHAAIIRSITALYSGSASASDMAVYAQNAIYDDPFSYCDTAYKIAGQWYGIPKLFASSVTEGVEVVSDAPEEIVFKLRQRYTLRGVHAGKSVDSLVSLGLDAEGKVRYHKDMWNQKDYDHEGLGKVIKKLNGDYLTGITKPPGDVGTEEGRQPELARLGGGEKWPGSGV